jgi:hypothetical protein
MDMNIKFSPTLLYNFMHLQFISDVCEKIPRRSKIVKYSKKVKIVPNLRISLV